MRLTNVSQMQTQPGRLSSYRVRATPSPEADLTVSFDQKRHVSFGSRPGSWMAVAFMLEHVASADEIEAAWLKVVERHGTLRTVFRTEEDRLTLHPVYIEAGQWEQLGVMTTAAETRRALREHFDVVCEPFAEPSHRLCAVQPEDAESPGARTQIVIGSDHSHVDAWSLLVLIRDFTTCLENLRAGRTPGTGLPEAEAFASHSAVFANKPFPPQEIVTRWQEILDAGGGVMPTFPLPLGDLSEPRAEVVDVRDVLDPAGVGRLEAHASEQGVRLIAVAVSVMTQLFGELGDRPLRTVFPVHSREDPRWFDSVGWFITNAVLENDDADYQACARAVKEAIRLGSYPLGPIMAPYGGMPAEPGMFAMSWLDHRRLPIAVPEEIQPQHISAVIRPDGVMIWFVINETGLHLRCRYPDTEEARATMSQWLDRLVERLQAKVT